MITTTKTTRRHYRLQFLTCIFQKNKFVTRRVLIASYKHMRDDLDDISLIQLVLQGRQNAYAVLVDRYSPYVFTLTMRYINDREVAEEVAQDVFVKAYRHLADFKGNCKFSTWLYTIVHTTCLSQLRKKGNEHLPMEEDKMIAISDNDIHEKPFESIDQKSRKFLLQAAMQHLSPDESEILTLFYQAEQSIDEIGTILGLTKSNVKVRLYRARQKLKEILETRYSAEFVD